ncbi:MAG: GNAT family acetyltransferase, partial [Myxococcota bacterium]
MSPTLRPIDPDFEVRCEWGEEGVAALSPGSDAVVIVDVLSFSTAVEVATARAAAVVPHRWRGDSAADRARELGAWLAGPRGGRFSLSPASLETLPPGSTLVLPSPNGSTLSLATGATPTFAGCLRNAQAVAEAAALCGPRVSVVPAGERWPDDRLRACFEDQVGAGAILRHLCGRRSPEAVAAIGAFEAAAGDLAALLRGSLSGRELLERGFGADVTLAAQLDVSPRAPRLRAGIYRASADPPAASDPGTQLIRAYREGDEADVVALWAQAFPESPPWNDPISDIRRKLSVQRELFLVALEAGRVVGTAMAGFDGHRGWVHYVATSPSARSQGLGRALLAEVEARLVARGCTKLNLQVRG